MSILESKKIDLVARKPDSPVVKLIIADHLTWDDLQSHSQLLQDKINAYLEFVLSGEIHQLKEPSIPESPEIRIVLATKHSPSAPAREYLSKVEEFLLGYGILFQVDDSHKD